MTEGAATDANRSGPSVKSTLPLTAHNVARILFASLIGTTIEFFDFYIYATAAVLVFPKLFFPKGDPTSATLLSLATFALAFLARPIGSAVFGHFGDRVGRKTTLVAALLTMGLSTVLIGMIPTYASIGLLAPLLLALCRIGQGLGLGGEWGGAVLLATENAPPNKQSWYGMFPQLGAPLGFLCSTGVFLLLSHWGSEQQFFAWGWRVPFLSSALLVFVGLYVRLRLTETPAFKLAMDKNERVTWPMRDVITVHRSALLRGTCIAIATFTLFYLMTVFALSWGTNALKIPRQEFLLLQMAGVVFFAITIPISAALADRIGQRAVLVSATVGIMMFGLLFARMLGSGSTLGIASFLALGFTLIGLTYGPLGAALCALFPTSVRYTGTSLAFNFAGIVGASLAPYIATWLATRYGLAYVGYYLSAAALITLLAWIGTRRS
jgi:metabolite-proton symporter